MGKALEWIGKNLSLGGLVRNAGSALGKTSKFTARVAGVTAAVTVKHPATKQKVKLGCMHAGTSLDKACTTTGAVIGNGIDLGVRKIGSAAGNISGHIAEAAGASEENVQLARKVGTVIGVVAVGAAVGTGVADAAVAIAATAGTAGAAATTSGLAALGGGSLAAGGGGMAAGQAIVQGIVAAGAASGAATISENQSADSKQ
jgi:hypothetical protein